MWLKNLTETDPTLLRVRHVDFGKSNNRELISGQYYANLRYLSGYVGAVNRFDGNFHLCAYSRGSLVQNSEAGQVSFQSFLSPEFFQGLDAKNLHNVTMFNKKIFGPIPFNGELNLEIGLFSVKHSEMMEPFLSLLNELSEKTSLPYVSTAQTFINIADKGMDSFFRRTENKRLEVGFSRDYRHEEVREGAFVTFRSNDEIPFDELEISSTDSKLVWKDSQKSFIDCPYLAFEIYATEARNRWQDLPNISESYNNLKSAVLGRGSVEDAFRNFELECLFSPDLIDTDRKKIVREVKSKFSLDVTNKNVLENEISLEGVAPENALENDYDKNGYTTIDLALGLPSLSYFDSLKGSELAITPPKKISNTMFDQALRFCLKWEGGISDHRDDPGGLTNHGITQTVYEEWLKNEGSPIKSVKNITQAEVFDIYRNNYWDKSHCPDLVDYEELALLHFDTAVNMGVIRAAKILQEAVGAKADGIIGKKTLEAIHQTSSISAKSTMTIYCDIRERVYQWLANNREWAKSFIKGWLNRLNDLRIHIGILPYVESIMSDKSLMPIGRIPDLKEGERLEGAEENPG